MCAGSVQEAPPVYVPTGRFIMKGQLSALASDIASLCPAPFEGVEHLVVVGTQSGSLQLLDTRPHSLSIVREFKAAKNLPVRGLRWLDPSRVIYFVYTTLLRNLSHVSPTSFEFRFSFIADYSTELTALRVTKVDTRTMCASWTSRTAKFLMCARRPKLRRRSFVEFALHRSVIMLSSSLKPSTSLLSALEVSQRYTLSVLIITLDPSHS